ncbi:hypothetical protein D869_gp182 [Caulobacter phage CcrRogue]|uniref:Uncharacterized protein n=1 Tax=Caulobacter phage CcrRogue TaxID=2927986 RepID=K4K3B9_9CAUD|nr:hypothetical protein D869_gp182 [Caulobacter phage CcrRogue]AFU86732.1 hypothetical protein CcrRogue_gp250 [Caulobacter phage CcrRogue]
MCHLAHTQGCRECPFKRTAAPGWLGADTPEGFLRATMSGSVQMPCHMTVDYDADDWREQAADAPFCAGALIFLKNICNLPHDPKIVAARAQVEPNREDYFARPDEFLAHHGG